VQIYLIIALLFALMVAIFSIQNAGGVDIRLFHWYFPAVSLVLVILGSAVVGAVCAFLLGMPKQMIISRKIKSLLADKHRLQAEIEQLKSSESVPKKLPAKEGTCQISN